MVSTAAVILAAGNSSRMGRTKQLLHLDGKSLIRRTVEAAAGASLKPIIVVTGAEAEAVKGELSGLPVQIAFNANWWNGIGSSIRRGIAALLETDPSISAAMILLCDQPRLDPSILRDLAAAHANSAKPMAACQYAGTVGPPCCFDRIMFGALQAIADNEGAKRLLSANKANVTVIDWPDGSYDLDTPDDLKHLSADGPPPK
jgi:molybdenum cofactor cytidylyltransferase